MRAHCLHAAVPTATDASVGASKADTMAARVRDINPLCDVTIVRDFVSEENVEAILGLENLNRNRRDDVPYKTIDFVVDAIDAERDKAAVIACCVHHRVPVITVGGAGGVDALGISRRSRGRGTGCTRDPRPHAGEPA